jgi:hypothetical protein
MLEKHRSLAVVLLKGVKSKSGLRRRMKAVALLGGRRYIYGRRSSPAVGEGGLEWPNNG